MSYCSCELRKELLLLGAVFFCCGYFCFYDLGFANLDRWR